MECAVTTLGWHRYAGVPPSLWIRTARSRVLVNCGENTQRFMTESRLSISKVEDITILEMEPENVSGLLGFLLTVSVFSPCDVD